MFSFLKRHRKKNKEHEEFQSVGEAVVSRPKKQYEAVEICEQMIDTSRELENIRDEYRLVTNYLNDIQILEELPEEDRNHLIETANNIVSLTAVRDELLVTKNRISESQFAQIQEEEDTLPASIKRLEANETYLSTIERDLHTLEGEKLSWEIEKRDLRRESRQLRKISVWLLVFFATLVVLYFILTFAMEMSLQLPMLIITFLVAVSGAYILFRYQDCQRDIKQCDVNINHAITLENHVKIKYVNIKNAVDYALEKYHISNSKELIYNYEQYQETVREQRKFREANDDLSYYSEKLIGQLRAYHLYDARVWINYPHAICDKREMVEVKHNLIVRRQKLRQRMEFNVDNLNQMKDRAYESLDEKDKNYFQINQIIKRLEEINQSAL